MIHLGITGNIGCGKSSVAKIFRMFGLDIYDADVEAKKLYKKIEVKSLVEEILGFSITLENGETDFRRIADKYFNNTAIYKSVNEILYPALNLALENIIKNSASHTLTEAALLYETGMQNMFDYTICVSTLTEVRQQRVEKFRHTDKAEFERRDKLQMPQDEKELLADFIIYNNDDDFVIPQVEKILKKIGIRK